MVLFILGSDYSTSSAFIPNCGEIKSIILGQSLNAKLLETSDFKSERGLFIIDITN
jgi:hypothetical protein